MPREIFYTFNASAPPADPTVNSTKYTAPLAYPVGGGYYKAIAREEGIVTAVVSKSFERAPEDYVHYYEFVGNGNDSVGTKNLNTSNVTYGPDRHGVANRGVNIIQSSGLSLVQGIGYPQTSVSMWVNTTNAYYATYLYCSNPYYYYHLVKYNTGSLGIYPGATVYAMQLNTYYHLVLTQDGTNVKIYVNGGLAGNITSSRSITVYPINQIGGALASGETADGKIEDVKVWSRILSDAEAMQIYNLG